MASSSSEMRFMMVESTSLNGAYEFESMDWSSGL